MRKEEFLNVLKRELNKIPYEEVDNILDEYRIKIEKSGITEDPYRVAKEKFETWAKKQEPKKEDLGKEKNKIKEALKNSGAGQSDFKTSGEKNASQSKFKFSSEKAKKDKFSKIFFAVVGILLLLLIGIPVTMFFLMVLANIF